MMKFIAPFLVLFSLATGLSAQVANGTWNGPFKSNGPSGTFDFVFSGTAETLAGNVAIEFGGQQASGKARDVKIDADKLVFTVDLAGAEVHFTATIRTAKLQGTFEGYENKNRTIVGAFCASKAGSPTCSDADIPAIPNLATATQRADETYDTSIAKPAYLSKGPRVLFDEAHKNFHKTTTNFKPFADLIRNDGYLITANPDPFTAQKLKGYNLLVISNARGEGNGSAFTDDEIESVAKWVENGGSLLLVADHAPFGGYAEKLANRFGVDMSKGYTDDPANRDPVIKDLLFSRENKLLGDHPIINGRNSSERINRIVSFTGQSLKAPKAAVILKLSDTAYDEFPDSDKKISAAGRGQAIAMKFGKGKVFVSGEAAMLTAQFSADGRKFGMNVPGIDNRQYALNVVHWLSGLLKEP